ncbi:MAG: hypothetical protein V9G04_13225 [Nocardioides sp.]
MSTVDPDALEALARAEQRTPTPAPTPAPRPPRPDAVRVCPRCRDRIGGGPEGWARHDAGLDSADQLMHDNIEHARAEQRDRTSLNYLGRVTSAHF